MKRSTLVVLCAACGVAGATGYPIVAPIVVPHYAAAYAPGDTAAALTALDTRLAAIDAKLDKLLKLAEDDSSPEQPKPDAGTEPAGDPKFTALKTAAIVCAGCHHADKYQAQGGGFKMFEQAGQFAKLTPRKAGQLVQLVEAGDMPPKTSGKTLTPEQRTALAELFKAQTTPLPKP